MGTSKSAAEFSQKIVKMGTLTQARAKATVDRGAFATKSIIVAEAASKGVTSASRIAGGKWGVGYDVKGFNNPTALVKIRGPFQLVERDTKPHTIGPRRRGRRSSGKKAVAFNGNVRRTVHHPGTHGKGIFAAAKKKAEATVPKIMAQSVIGGWRDALK